MLIGDETGRQIVKQRRHAVVEAIAYTKTYLDNAWSSYELAPRNASAVRRGLLRMTLEGDHSLVACAARCLTAIDEQRDRGAAIDESKASRFFSPYPMAGRGASILNYPTGAVFIGRKREYSRPPGLADRRQSAPDNHRRAVRHAVIEIDNVLVDQPHAARGHGLTN